MDTVPMSPIRGAQRSRPVDLPCRQRGGARSAKPSSTLRASSPCSIDESEKAFRIRRALCRNCDSIFLPEFSVGGDVYCTVDCKTMDRVYGRFIRRGADAGATRLSEAAKQVAEDAKRTKQELQRQERIQTCRQTCADPAQPPPPKGEGPPPIGSSSSTATQLGSSASKREPGQQARYPPLSSDTATISAGTSPPASQPEEWSGQPHHVKETAPSASRGLTCILPDTSHVTVATSPIMASSARRPGGLTLLFQSLEA